MQPSAEVMNLSGNRAVMETVLISSDKVTSDQQLSRDEELLWEEEQGW